jgi:hypothetical protein
MKRGNFLKNTLLAAIGGVGLTILDFPVFGNIQIRNERKYCPTIL